MNEVDKALIDAMANYGLEHAWSDKDVFDALIEIGFTREDFQNCGYGDFVSQFFGN